MAKSSTQSAGNKQARGTGKAAASPASSTAATASGNLLKAQAASPAAQAGGQSAIDALKQDHRRVEGLFSEFESATDDDRKQELVATICTELNIHTRLEEEIFYPACREAIEDDEEDVMDEAQVEHDAAKLLIADLTDASSDDPFYDAKVKLLSEMIKHHVAEEEKPGEGIFAKAEEHNVDNASLASQLASRKQALQSRGQSLRPTHAVSFNLDLGSLMEVDFDGERDERRRFSDRSRGSGRYDDDERRGRGRGAFGERGEDAYRGRSRGRYDDENDERGSRGGWFGDSEGRSGAGRERGADDEYRDRSRGRYEDNDRERGGRGRGGWFGDPEGHSHAARGRREDDDERRGSRSRYDEGDESRGGGDRGRGGWFGDPEGHSRAARSRRDDDDDRGGRNRSSSRSRSRDDDDDSRGWFGDSRGHAEAARRGWAHRR